jgi:hypothetical protein
LDLSPYLNYIVLRYIIPEIRFTADAMEGDSAVHAGLVAFLKPAQDYAGNLRLLLATRRD